MEMITVLSGNYVLLFLPALIYPQQWYKRLRLRHRLIFPSFQGWSSKSQLITKPHLGPNINVRGSIAYIYLFLFTLLRSKGKLFVSGNYMIFSDV